jgi:hypothetical protein
MLLTFRQHAIQRMFERSIAPDEIRAALAHGSVIESYPDDTPYPSQLWWDTPIRVRCILFMLTTRRISSASLLPSTGPTRHNGHPT